MKQISRKEINALADDFLTLSHDSLNMLRAMGFINGHDVVNALMIDKNITEDI